MLKEHEVRWGNMRAGPRDLIEREGRRTIRMRAPQPQSVAVHSTSAPLLCEADASNGGGSETEEAAIVEDRLRAKLLASARPVELKNLGERNGFQDRRGCPPPIGKQPGIWNRIAIGTAIQSTPRGR